MFLGMLYAGGLTRDQIKQAACANPARVMGWSESANPGPTLIGQIRKLSPVPHCNHPNNLSFNSIEETIERYYHLWIGQLGKFRDYLPRSRKPF